MAAYTDDFNRADGAPGANWADPGGLFSIVSNKFQHDSSSTNGLAVFQPAATTDDQEVSFDFVCDGNAGHFIAIWARLDSASATIAASNAYIFYTNNDNSTAAIEKITTGTVETSLLDLAGAFTLTNGVTYTMKLRVQGTALTAFINGTQVGTVTDSSITTGKFSGLSCSTANFAVDNWAFGDYALPVMPDYGYYTAQSWTGRDLLESGNLPWVGGNLGISAGTTTVVAQTCTITLSAQHGTVTPSACTVVAQTCTLDLSAIPGTVTPSARTVVAQPATITLSAVHGTITPSPVTVVAQPCVLSLTPSPGVVTPSPVTVVVQPCTITLSAIPGTITVGSATTTVVAQTCTLTLTAVAGTVTPSPVTVVAQPCTLHLTLSPGVITPAAAIVVAQPATIALTAIPGTIVASAATVIAQPATITLTAVPGTIVAGTNNIVVVAQPCIITLTATPGTVTSSPVTVVAQPCTIRLYATPGVIRRKRLDKGGAVRHTGKTSPTRARPTKTIRVGYEQISDDAALVHIEQVSVVDRLLELAATLPPLWEPTPALLPLPCDDDELVLLLC